ELDRRRAEASPTPSRANVVELGTSGRNDQQGPANIFDQPVEQVEQRRLGPVDVLDEHDGGPMGHHLLHEAHPTGLKPVAGCERVHVARNVQSERETEDGPLPQVLQHRFWWIAFENPEFLLENLAEWPVGDSSPVRETTARSAKRLGNLASKLLPELADQPRLADAGLAADCHEVRAGALGYRPVGVLHAGQLCPPGDERTTKAADAPRAHQRKGPQQTPASQPFRLALGLDDRGLCELESATNSGHGPLPREDLAGGGRLLEPRRDVDRVAGDKRASLAGAAEDDFAGVHAYAQRQ